MKRVLIISYPFPPTGGPGVQRTLKFTKYLRNFGWEPVILTRKVANMKLQDNSLNKDIPEGICIYRTNPWELAELPGILQFAGKFISIKFLIPDKERLWAAFSKKKAAKIVKSEGIDLIYTTSVPYSAHLIGLHLKRRFPDIPWVADFRDEWTNNPYLLDNPHNAIRMRIERRMEKCVLEKSDCLITNTPVMLGNFLKNNQIQGLSDRFFTIPNGYDRDDFEHIEYAKIRNGRFTIVYTGSFYGRRKPDTFFQALSELINEGKIHCNKINVKLIGLYKSGQIHDLIKMYSLTGIIELQPYIPHDECVREMMQSDALLLIEGSGIGGDAFYTGKVFEYMIACKPILAIVPENGAAASLINQTRTGLVSDSNDIKKIKYNIFELYNSWLENKNNFSPDLKEIRKYDRKVLTEELSKVFELSLRHLASKKRELRK